MTLEDSSAKEQFQLLLDCLDELTDTHIIFTKTNSDTDGRIINQMINYVSENNHKTVGYTSLGQLRYLSALQFMDALIGNSSSGLSEVPSFKIWTINIGDRQKSRLKADSIIDYLPTKLAIGQAIERLYSMSFQKLLKTVKNPYGDGMASKKIIKIIKEPIKQAELKKTFFDIK